MNYILCLCSYQSLSLLYFCFHHLVLQLLDSSLDLFRRFTGFGDVRLVKGGFDNTHVIALVEFNTLIQAFCAMKSLQGECYILVFHLVLMLPILGFLLRCFLCILPLRQIHFMPKLCLVYKLRVVVNTCGMCYSLLAQVSCSD